MSVKIEILNDTFTQDGVNAYGTAVGTVKVRMGEHDVEVRAQDLGDHGIAVAGFVGRYVTSPKPWLAHVCGKGAALMVHFGRDDRSGRFNKRNAIRFEPETYAGLVNPKAFAAA